MSGLRRITTPASLGISAYGQTLVAAADAAAARSVLGSVIGMNVQAYDADLDALAGISTAGILARTGAGTAAARTLTGTSNQISISNGTGAAGDPVFSLPQDYHTTATVQLGNLGIGAAVNSATEAFLIDRNYTQPTTTVHAASITSLTNSITANNANAIIGLRVQNRVNQNGFNLTLASGGIRGFAFTTQVTGSSGTVTLAVGSFGDVLNTGAGTLTRGAAYYASGGGNTGGGTYTDNIAYLAAARTSGTNNYSFVGEIAAAANRWNLYMSGTAQNYLAGKLGLGNATPDTVLDVTGDAAIRQTSGSLSNGVNNDVSTSAKSYIRITGPTAGFSISSLANPFDGKIVILHNATTQAMTITNAAATGTAANRILTNTGADIVTTAEGSVSLIYSTADSRWIVFATAL